MRFSPPSGRYRETVLKLLQGLSVLSAGYFVWYAITDSDIFWHLAAGREMVIHKAFLFTDPFSYTLPDARWFDVHWFFQLVMYLIWRTGGYPLLLVIKTVLITVSLLLVATAFKRSTATVITLLFSAVIIYFQRYLIPLRPIIFTLPLIALFFRQLERYCVDGKLGTLIPVVVGQVIWVNSQGLFMLGIVIAAAYGIGESVQHLLSRRFATFCTGEYHLSGRQLRVLLILPVILAAASLINPYGWHALHFALKLFFRINPAESNIYAQTIIENMPLLSMFGTRYTGYVIVFIILSAALLFSTLYTVSSMRIAYLLCAGAGMLLAVMAQRNGILFTFFALPALIRNCNQIISYHAPKAARIVSTAALTGSVCVLLFTIVNHTKMLRQWPHTLSPFSHPVRSAELLSTVSFSGNLFNADRYGGYLLWKCYPRLKVSHDTRLTLRPGSFYREYLTMVRQPEHFYSWAEKRDISTVCLPVAPIDRYLPLAASLYRKSNWRLAFTDGSEVLFLQDTSSTLKTDLSSTETLHEITSTLQKRFEDSPPLYEEACGYLAGFCIQTGLYRSADEVLDPFNSPRSRVMKAISLERSGNIAEARTLLETLVSDYRRYSDGRLQLALFYLRNNQKNEGIRQLSLLLKKDPFHRRARNVLFNLTKKRKE
jgi:hypothetical protein